MNINDKNAQMLIGMAAKACGRNPDEVKKSIEKDGGQSLISTLSPSDKAKLNSLLANPAVTKLLRAGDIKGLSELINGGGNKRG